MTNFVQCEHCFMPEGNGLNFVVVGHVWAGVIGRAVGVYTVWIWSSRGIYSMDMGAPGDL